MDRSTIIFIIIIIILGLLIIASIIYFIVKFTQPVQSDIRRVTIVTPNSDDNPNLTVAETTTLTPHTEQEIEPVTSSSVRFAESELTPPASPTASPHTSPPTTPPISPPIAPQQGSPPHIHDLIHPHLPPGSDESSDSLSVFAEPTPIVLPRTAHEFPRWTFQETQTTVSETLPTIPETHEQQKTVKPQEQRESHSQMAPPASPPPPPPISLLDALLPGPIIIPPPEPEVSTTPQITPQITPPATPPATPEVHASGAPRIQEESQLYASRASTTETDLSIHELSQPSIEQVTEQGVSTGTQTTQIPEPHISAESSKKLKSKSYPHIFRFS